MNSSSEMCDTSFSITTATHSFRRTSLYVAEEDLQPNPHLDCFREVVVLSFSSPLSKCICRRSAADLNARIVPTQLTCAVKQVLPELLYTFPRASLRDNEIAMDTVS